MLGKINFKQLVSAVGYGEIDTVLVCQTDMQGRLMGKRFHAKYFIDTGGGNTHSCNYLLATDYEMETIDGYKSSSWKTGYGDYIMSPDLDTIRIIPWLEKTAVVLCDVIDHVSHLPVSHSPRAILKKQIARFSKLGFVSKMASELEFFLFDKSYEEAYSVGYSNLKTLGKYNEDYNIFQTSKEESVMQAIRNGLFGAGISVECSKGEAAAGQEEINVKYDYSLNMADQHVIIKNACKEIAWQKGKALSFMAKWNSKSAGSSSHIHQSLWSTSGEALFYDINNHLTMSELMEHYIAGQLKHAKAITYFLAPNINSYKRFSKGSFAPTKIVWSDDNRTAGFRVCGVNSKSIRLECRIGGSDLNPYLAAAGLLAAGIDGIENKLKLENEFKGDAYKREGIQDIPKTLLESCDELNNSSMIRKAFGKNVIDHYVRTAHWELEEYNKTVTNWEINRGFEKA